MKNAIKYYYNLELNDIHQYKKEYKFHSLNKDYILYEYTGTIRELEEKYNIQTYINSIGMYSHKIIKNNNNELATIINKKKYVLIEIENENRIINIMDIMNFAHIYLNKEFFKAINRTDWKKLWKEKIDYIEYQISQFGKKYTIIRESSDYYIGIAETCISLISNTNIEKRLISCTHDRLNKKTNTIEFYNPINFIVDTRVRDIGEYLTQKLYEEDITLETHNYINYNNLTSHEIILLFIRIIYPSNYFDICETIIEGKENENTLIKLVNKNAIFEQNIKKLYKYIKKMITIPEIEWLSKPTQY